MTLPTFKSYGNYSSANYGSHCLKLMLPEITIWFSYQTPVAFAVSGNVTGFVRENDLGPITGRHLNWIDGVTNPIGCLETNLKDC